MRTTDADRFTAYYTARYRALRRTAYLLCGDWHEAEDLTHNLMPPWKRSFDRHALSLDQLAAIVADPGALRYFPHR